MSLPSCATFQVFLFSAGFAIAAIGAAAAADCPSAVGTLVSVQGDVQVQRAGSSNWQHIGLDAPLCEGDVLYVGERSRIEASLSNQVRIRADQNTMLRMISPPEKPVTWLGLLSGAAYFFSRQPRSLNVDTPFVNAAVEGTEFIIRVADQQTEIGVFNGKVVARNGFGEATITNGRSSVAAADAAPTETLLVRPFDAVQWAMYFPPVLDIGTAAAQLPPDLWQAVDLAAQGRTTEAFARFEAIPADQRDAAFYLYRAQTLLAVGRVDEADADLQQALALDPGNAEAYAVQAVIAVSRNQQEQALQLAQHAVALAPTSAAAKIALSFAEQARFQIAAARDAVQQAVEDAPDNALAWARLSELWLMLGFRDRAVETARHARELAPDLARVQTVLGFAALAEFDRRRAEKAFRAAIERDQADPQPRFGLGLALIRGGALRDGREQIEGAVLLDPNNSLLRSYLGKAYFEEKRDHLSSEQYALAKELDPNDPTPWLYDAILKQTENRPVEALHDLQKSMALNDNRAVFRSRELLDQDQAARGASLGRIYNDLGFEYAGINAATDALALDPSSSSAHRFLADVYATMPRRDIAAASQLLQAQLLQNININPVQPTLSETNLNIVTQGGPSRPGFNEYNALFERNRAQFDFSGLLGSNWTRAGEVLLSGVYDKYSISAGQFNYQSDGFRENFGVNHTISDIFSQVAITPELNIQGEYRRRRSEQGNLILNFDNDNFSKTSHNDFDQDIGRFGLRYSPLPFVTFLTSIIAGSTHNKDILQDSSDFRVSNRIAQAEPQAIIQDAHSSVVLGALFNNTDTNLRLRGGPDVLEATQNWTTIQHSVYTYINHDIFDNLTTTIGLTYDDFRREGYDIDYFSPKIGVRYSPLEPLTLRAAAFRTLKPALATGQTVQPTEVSGFNQFFDDPDGTRSTTYSVGADMRVANNVMIGFEADWRQLDTPFTSAYDGSVTFVNQNDNLYRGYIYWTPSEQWALTSELQYDQFHSDNINVKELDTFSTPVGISYFAPWGLFATAGVTYVHQTYTTRNSNLSPLVNNDKDDGFFLVDVGMGYRFPKRLGIISFEVTNLTNEHFSYTDDSFRELFVNSVRPHISPYIPERAFFCRLTLTY